MTVYSGRAKYLYRLRIATESENIFFCLGNKKEERKRKEKEKKQPQTRKHTHKKKKYNNNIQQPCQ